ncbi:MAG: ABC transporter substrate-binding protein [Janthinobacterium lividum]
MTLSRRSLLGSAALATTLPLARARAQAPTLRIGVLTDLSGPYQDTTGRTSVICTQQAVDEFASAHGLAVQVLSADHQNKPDVGAGIARQWFDRDGVDVVIDVPNSAVALAVAAVAHEKDKVMIASSSATTVLTGEQCSPGTIHWTFDTYMLSHSTGGALVRAGGDSWYFIGADYAFGHTLADDTAAVIRKAGGKVLGSVFYPSPGTTDFSSFLLQAQASGAKVVGFANAGAETINCVKQAHEFGLTSSAKLAALLMYVTDVHALGLDTAQGLSLTETFYWDLNDRTRAFTDRVRAKTPSNIPNMDHAGCYAGALHYMKAAAAMGMAEAKRSGAATVGRMKAMPTDDDCFGPGSIRADGRVLHPAYLFEAKRPAESKGAWDLLRLAATTPAEEAFRPLAEGRCPLVHA